MKNVKYFCVVLLGVFLTLSCEEKDLTNGLKPMVVTLALSQTGEQVVDLVDANPSYSFDILKNYPTLETTVTLTPLPQEELDESFVSLAEDQYVIENAVIDLAASEMKHNIVVRFKNVMNLDPAKTYALGLRLTSSNEDVQVEKDKNTVIITLRLGEKGTIANPHRLATAEDLKAIKDKLIEGQVNYFRMTEDIDLKNEPWNVLNYDRKYIINFDGDNHKIKNLNCSGGAASFFGVLNDGICENVTFENAVISGDNTPVGVVAGLVVSGIVRNVHVSGSVIQTGGGQNWGTGFAGGICGKLEGGKAQIKDCSSDVDVTGEWCVGGITGESNSATLISCSKSTGKIISHKGFSGGIVGNMYHTTVSDCYSEGEVWVKEKLPTEANCAGGIVGRVDREAELYNCYSSALINAKGNGGGIVGATAWGTNPTGNIIIGCIAWNSSITATDGNSSRITGFMNQNSSWGNTCYGKAALEVIVPGGAPQTDPRYMDTEELDTTGGAKVYNGINVTNIIEVAKSTLHWKPEVWDFSGNCPVFLWEKK